MKHFVTGLMAMALVAGASWAETALMFVTPTNIKDTTFTVKSKTVKRDAVEFVIRRDVKGIDRPASGAYLNGKEIKLKTDGNRWTYRFTVPKDQVANSVFTLWGAGAPGFGEGVTYRFNLADFRRGEKD